MAGTATVMTRLENVVAVDQEKEMEELVVANGVDINTIQQVSKMATYRSAVA